jgi:hypothetical protein
VNLDVPVPEILDTQPGYYPSDEQLAQLSVWSNRTAKAIFVGGANTYVAGMHNYAPNARLRLKLLAVNHPHLLDVRLYQMPRVSPALTAALTKAGAPVSGRMPVLEKFNHKYQIAAAGGVHSSSLCGALGSGQLLIAQDMPYAEYFYPALTPGVHFISTHRMFADLIPKLEALHAHDEYAHNIAQQGARIAPIFCSAHSRVLYWAVLLQRVQAMTAEPESIMEPTACSQGLAKPKLPAFIDPTAGTPMCDAMPANFSALEISACHHMCVPANITQEGEAKWFWAEIDTMA